MAVVGQTVNLSATGMAVQLGCALDAGAAGNIIEMKAG